jgi:hypothetical protein
MRFRRRMMVGCLLHPLLTTLPGLRVTKALASRRLLPYNLLLGLLR